MAPFLQDFHGRSGEEGPGVEEGWYNSPLAFVPYLELANAALLSSRTKKSG